MTYNSVCSVPKCLATSLACSASSYSFSLKPIEKIDKIFDRYYRGVNDGGNWSGTGIGLKICKSLVNLMNGAISVTSDIGKKTVFKIKKFNFKKILRNIKNF